MLSLSPLVTSSSETRGKSWAPFKFWAVMTGCFKGRVRVKGAEESDSSMKNYRELATINVIGQLCLQAGNYGSWDSIFPRRLGDRGPILPDISQEWLSDPQEKYPWVIGNTYISLRDRKKFHSCKPFLVNALGKGSQVLTTINSKFCWEPWAFPDRNA